MKIHLITKQPFPNGMAATNRIKSYAKALKNEGIECIILIFKRTEINSRRNINVHGYYEGIPFKYMGTTTKRHKNLIVRKYNDYNDYFKLKKYLKTELKSGDIVFAYCGDLIWSSNDIINIVHSRKAKFVRDLCELPYGTKKETIITKCYRYYILKFIFPKIDGVIAISESLKKLANKYMSNPKGQLKIPIMVDFDEFETEDASVSSEIEYIFHSGTLYEQKDGILGMIEAFGIASQQMNQPIHFISTGTIEKSPHAKEIRLLINKYNLNNKIFFKGYLNDCEKKECLSKATLVIINKYRTLQNEYCFSTKLGEYLAAAKPVIITNVGEAINWLKDRESAYIIEPGDTKCLAKTIIEVFNNPEERKHIALKGKEICKKNFDYRIWGRAMTIFFESLF